MSETRAKLSTKQVINACCLTITSIDQKRRDMKTAAVQYKLHSRGRFATALFGPMTPEHAERLAESEHMFGAPWHYTSGFAYEAAKRVLALARATEYPDMYVSSDDFAYIGYGRIGVDEMCEAGTVKLKGER